MTPSTITNETDTTAQPLAHFMDGYFEDGTSATDVWFSTETDINQDFQMPDYF